MKSSKCDFNKLKTNLNVCTSRLEVLATRRAERSRNSRRILVDCLMQKKLERAKVRAEEMIRDDYYVEALDLVKAYFGLVASRLTFLQNSSAPPEPSLKVAISTIIWASPLLKMDVPECKPVIEAFTKLFGKQYVQNCLSGSEDSISHRVKQKLDVIPGYNMIEVYMMEVAEAYKIPYEPDEKIISALRASASASSHASVASSSSSTVYSEKSAILGAPGISASCQGKLADDCFMDASNLYVPSAPPLSEVSSIYYDPHDQSLGPDWEQP